jgi:subtilisin-like proprotein convertase family protein
MPGGTSTVEYTLTVPTRYERGKVFLSYPRLADGAAPNLAVPVFTIRPGWGDATTAVKIDGARKAPGAPIVLARPTEPAWLAAISHTSSASYVSSVVEVEDAPAARRTFATATVTLDIEHTYKSDLRVALVTPKGDEVEVFDGSGGSDNDVRGAFTVELPPDTPAIGTWRLVVSDHAALDAGTLSSWSLALGDGKLTAAAADLPLYIPDAPENASDGGVAMIELAPPTIDTVATRLGRSSRRSSTRSRGSSSTPRRCCGRCPRSRRSCSRSTRRARSASRASTAARAGQGVPDPRPRRAGGDRAVPPRRGAAVR